ncbi:hypothetical protein F4780DRAFT_372707 [Xylariomycetidae sp. FL0641]|nr:hypothetical protein F4780DRAFT_372707 [Xylariomycetidae sp. FL0641]
MLGRGFCVSSTPHKADVGLRSAYLVPYEQVNGGPLEQTYRTGLEAYYSRNLRMGLQARPYLPQGECNGNHDKRHAFQEEHFSSGQEVVEVRLGTRQTPRNLYAIGIPGTNSRAVITLVFTSGRAPGRCIRRSSVALSNQLARQVASTKMPVPAARPDCQASYQCYSFLSAPRYTSLRISDRKVAWLPRIRLTVSTGPTNSQASIAQNQPGKLHNPNRGESRSLMSALLFLVQT